MAGEWALITGGTKGLGRAIAERFLNEGLDVVLTFNSDSLRAESVRDELAARFSPQRAEILRADAAALDDIAVIEQFLASRPGELRVLVLNAGLTDRSAFEELKPENWQKVLDANVTVPVFTIQRLLKYFGPGGSVILTGSAMGIHPHSMSLAYGVSKSAVHALVSNLVKFLAPYGIRVNGVAPGFIDTEWQLTKPETIRKSIESKIAVGRFATPEEIADLYWMITTNGYITGEVIAASGGYSYK